MSFLRRLGFIRPTGTSLGNALQALQVIVQPRVEHFITQSMDVKMDEESCGDPLPPLDPKRHILRQARRLQRGEAIKRLTALRTTTEN